MRQFLHDLPSQRVFNVDREFYPPATVLLNTFSKRQNYRWDSCQKSFEALEVQIFVHG